MGNLAFDLEDRFINKAFIIVSAMLCYVYNCRCGFIRTGGVIVEVALLQGKHFDTKPIKRVIRSSEGIVAERPALQHKPNIGNISWRT